MAASVDVRLRNSQVLRALIPDWTKRPVVWFLGLVSFVVMVSVHDAALLIVNQELIIEFEQNPIGAWLIHYNAGSVWLFIALKLLGTCLVVAVLASLYEHCQRLGFVFAVPLALFQATLLTYLYVA